MPVEIAVALLSLLGTAVGAFGGIVVSAKLTNYRLEQLEKKVAEHNHFATRLPLMQEQLKVVRRRVEALEGGRIHGC